MNPARRASISMGLLGLSLLLISIAIAFGVLPRMMHVLPIPDLWTSILAILAVVLAVAGILRLRGTLDGLRKAEDLPEPQRSDILYGRYLVGIGFALLIDALISSVVVIALAWATGRARLGLVTTTGDREAQDNLVGDGFNAGPLDQLQSQGAVGSVIDRFGTFFGNSADEALFVAALFAFSTLVALLGALFFFANSLWQRMREEAPEPFDRSIFWAGLWFRVGEAVLFNLVFFLLLRYYAPDQYLALPLVALLVGMFLKAGENLISGLANRVFAAFGELVPTTLKQASVMKILPLVPTNLPGPGAERDQLLVKLGEALGALKGVGRMMVDDAGNLQVEYDTSLANPGQIRHEVRMHKIELAA